MSEVASCLSRVVNTLAGIRTTARRISNQPARLPQLLAAFLLVLFSAASQCLGAEAPPPPVAASPIQDTNSQAVLRAYLQLQEQLKTTQLAIEQSLRETKAAVTQNAEVLAQGLQTIQSTFATQHTRDLEVMQQANNTMLLVTGAFAALGCLTMLLISYFQWRMNKGLASISAALPSAFALNPGPAVAQLPPPEPSDPRLLEMVRAHEKRLHELEHRPAPMLRPRPGANLAVATQLLPHPGASFRRHAIHPLRTALIVGLICAAALAIVLYLLTCKKFGLDQIYHAFKI
jgi:hypothetical protein